MSELDVAEAAGKAGADTSSAVRETEPPPHRANSEAPPPSEHGNAADPLDIAALLPVLDEGEAPLDPIEVSPELAQILDAAEQRASALGQQHSSIPAPGEELDVLLPPELLASLDEPLDPDDSEMSGASTGGTGPRATGNTGLTGGAGTTGGGTRGTGATTAAHLDRVTGGHDTRAGRASGPPTGVAPEGPPASRPPPPPPPPSWPESVPLAPRPPSRIGPLPPDMLAPARPPVPRPPGSAPGEPARPATGTGELARVSAAELARVPAAEMARLPGAEAARLPAVEAARLPPKDATRPPVGPAQAPAGAVETRPPPPLPPPPAPQAPRAPTAPAPPPSLPAPAEVQLPAVLGDGDAVRALSTAVASRLSGALALGPEAAVRRIVLHEGDIVTAASAAADESLLAFLAARGDLSREVAARLGGKLPPHGRHAGAALIAHGHLSQDDLWPVLRAHAEWIIGRALVTDEGTCELSDEPPGRLKAEPNVFGGATGAEVLLEQIRRVVPPELALRRLGGPEARLAEGPRRQLLAECALRPEDEQLVRSAPGLRVREIMAEGEPEIADVLYGLVSLGVLEALAPVAPAAAATPGFDPLDEEALRQRVRARVALVEEGDYFALLGIPRSATGYEIRRAYLELRRSFEPARVLTAATADLAADVRLVLEVLDEAYDILREPHRRERYRRAIEAGPP